jgi:murein DD-endopeptidase MepM/ murein hydrolase activator NlpD
MEQPPLTTILRTHRTSLSPLLEFDLTTGGVVVFDFTAANTELTRLDINDVAGFTQFLFARIVDAETPVGIGRYDEDRVLYRHSPLFDGQAERRSIHLGIDLFVVEGTEIRSPLPATVHSLANNAGLGDYGPTVILQHELDGISFFTLYGHLSRSSLEDLEEGRPLAAGAKVAEVGDLHENGGWPPHLHFQIISDLLGHTGDFPGVAAPSQRQHYLDLCPNPNLILGIPGL